MSATTTLRVNLNDQPVRLKSGHRYRIIVSRGPQTTVKLVDANTREPLHDCYIYLGTPSSQGVSVEHEGYCRDDGTVMQLAGGPANDGRPSLGEPLKLSKDRKYALVWSYGPVPTRPLQPGHGVTVTATPEIALDLADRMPGGKLHLQLWQPRRQPAHGGDSPEYFSFEPLANAAYTLTGPEGQLFSGTTDGRGELRHDDVPFASYQVKAGQHVAMAGTSHLDDRCTPVLLKDPQADSKLAPLGGFFRAVA